MEISFLNGDNLMWDLNYFVLYWERYMEFNFKKKFGQNFLKDSNVLNKIIEISNIDKESLIIEIGPGSGYLTRYLVKKGKVLSYEIDNDLKEILCNEFKDCENVEFIFDDFLKRNVKEDIKKYSYNKLYIVANLPYYITTPIINKLIEEKISIDKMVIMVQKEVGERFSAKPGNKDYSSITVFLNYYFDIKKEFVVSRNSFVPKPNVDSIVISFTKKKNKLLVNDENKFFKLIRDSFKYKRKTLKNNLNDYDFNIINKVLNQHNMSEDIRAEHIPIDIFIEISNNL